MHVLDAPDIQALVDVEPAVQRIGVEPPDVMPAAGATAEVDGLVRVQQEHVDDRAVVGARRGNRPRVGDGRVGGGLVRIDDRDPAQTGIGLEADERRTGRLARTLDRQQDAASQPRRLAGRRPRHGYRRRLPHPPQRHRPRHQQVARDAVTTRRHEDRAAPGEVARIQRLLEGVGVIGHAVALGAIDPYIALARGWIGLAHGPGAAAGGARGRQRDVVEQKLPRKGEAPVRVAQAEADADLRRQRRERRQTPGELLVGGERRVEGLVVLPLRQQSAGDAERVH